MDRVIVYDGALPQSTDILNTNKFGQVGFGYALRGILGASTVIHGLPCTPTSPASLQVNVGAGAIYTLDATDATGYGDLGVDLNQIVKQGIVPTTTTLTITPPGTGGFSQVFLVEAILSDVDAGLAVLPYFNASNPSQPFLGPGNNGMSQYTQRTVACSVALKAGVAAPTGSQVTPAPDAGYIGIYAITVANGQSTITSPNIVTLTTAPFFPTLPSVPNAVQTGLWTYCVDTGAVNAMVSSIQPPVTSLTPGLGVLIKVANTNTNNVTLNLNGLGAQQVHRANGAQLASGDITIGEILALVYDGSAFQTLNFDGFTATTTNNNTTTINIPYATDSGAVNAMVGIYSPVITSLSAGVTVEILAANTNTGATTLQCNALGAVALRQNGLPLQPRAIVAGQIYVLVHDGTFFQIVEARWPYSSFDESAPPSSDIFLAVGDQLNITWTGATSIPLKTATVPGVYEVTFGLTANNADDNDAFLNPNNQFYNNAMNNWYASNTDGSSSSPYLANSPNSYEKDCTGFQFDVFNSQAGDDPVNNKGPMIIRFLCQTYTASKMMLYFGGTIGGPGGGFCRWKDTTTLWTSLGTMVVGDTFTATTSGYAIVRRLA